MRIENNTWKLSQIIVTRRGERGLCTGLGLVEQKISFQMIPSMLRSDEYQRSYTYLNIQDSGPIEIGKWLIIYYLHKTLMMEK